MNYLLYLGGGYMWLMFWLERYSAYTVFWGHEYVGGLWSVVGFYVMLFSILSSWLWICLRIGR